MINADTFLNELLSLAQKGRISTSQIMTSLTFWVLFSYPRLQRTGVTPPTAVNESMDARFSFIIGILNKVTMMVNEI